jgi:hypothetical protein
MKFWAYFIAKLAASAAIIYGIWRLLYVVLPPPETFLYHNVSRFSQNLPWTTAFLVLWLIAIGLLYLVIWDQRRRCRTCLRVLRMPVESGSWSEATLFSPPQMESICPYGHGTLKVSEIQFTGNNPAEWRQHEDIWRELENLDSQRK